jgi:hypothetical protein
MPGESAGNPRRFCAPFDLQAENFLAAGGIFPDRIAEERRRARKSGP